MKNGFVYGIDKIKQLTDLSVKNIKKNNSDLLENGRIVMMTGEGTEGIKEHAPYDCIHIGFFVNKIPRLLIKQLAVGGRMVILSYFLQK